MSEKLISLYEKVSGDDSLKEAFKEGIKAAGNDDEKKSFIIDFAKEQGVTLTEEDFLKTDGVQHLSDDDLENVVGGAHGDAARGSCGEAAYVVCQVFFGLAGVGDYASDC